MAKAFSIEDGNIANKPIYSSVTRVYKDIDLTFARKPSGDIFKKQDGAAVKQAVKNLLLTNFTEKPFNPYYGGDLNRFLFELADGVDEIDIKDRIFSVIREFEPRAEVQKVETNLKPDENSIQISIYFTVLNVTDVVQLDISIARLR